MRSINVTNCCLGALVCLASLACFSGVVSPSIMIVTVAIEVALYALLRTEAKPKRESRGVLYMDPTTVAGS